MELRTLTDQDLPSLRRLDGLAFGFEASDSRWEAGSAVLERPRQTGAFVDGLLVGHTAAFTMDLTLPGDMVPAAGVTWVGVSPEYRRRGVMSALMRHQLHALVEDGEPVATLWAAEPAIYGRFGYGVASRKIDVTVPRGPSLSGPGPGDLRLRLGTSAELMPSCVEVYERVRPRVPGMVTRSDQAWRESSYDEPGERSSSPIRCVVALDQTDAPQAYAWFRTKARWQHGDPDGTVEVVELLASSPTATRALLDLVLDVDLTARTQLWNLALDHPLLTWTQHGHRLQPAIGDQLWLRLVRLDEALAARTYSQELDLVIDVSDHELERNSGRWQLSVDRTGTATVQRTTRQPDVGVDVRDLGAAYLGDDHLHRAARAGLVIEHAAGAAHALARAMRGDRAPWCSFMF
jgi:predicted acetyltransferase